MADQPIRVLFRWLAGIPMRQASEEEQRRALDSFGELVRKWKSEGVKHLGYWSSSGQVDGFGHYHILEVDDVSKAWQMVSELSRSEAGKYLEKLGFEIGGTYPVIEDMWESS